MKILINLIIKKINHYLNELLIWHNFCFSLSRFQDNTKFYRSFSFSYIQLESLSYGFRLKTKFDFFIELNSFQ